MEPLIFSSISNPINVDKSFNNDNICNLVEIFYFHAKKKKKKRKKEGKEKNHMRLQL